MKKFLKKFSYFIFVMFIVLLVLRKICMSIDLMMHDYCIEDGICPEGREIKVNGELIKISKETCIKNNGVWREDKNHHMRICNFDD